MTNLFEFILFSFIILCLIFCLVSAGNVVILAL